MTTGRGNFGLLNAALLFMSVLGIGLFARVESKAASPLIPLAMFWNWVLSAGFDPVDVGGVMSSGPITAALIERAGRSHGGPVWSTLDNHCRAYRNGGWVLQSALSADEV